MFRRILIANRGEIACRIASTCRRLGVETVAVYGEPDADAPHARAADRAVPIGGARPSDSYLAGERIIAAARATGAEAVHPGYGFLAENEAFARDCESAGLVFVGPRADTIEQMGSKARAKALMEAAGVPTVPGYHGSDQTPEHLAAEADRMGYPLMIKAAAGGGGKGMRIVRGRDGFAANLAAAQREAQNAFGDGRVILERYLEAPRHIEVQIFGDQAGRIVHLFERDCSSQRRYQKVIEEAPAPGLDPCQREALWNAAVQAGHAVDYVNAGTVEFIVGADGTHYFMEMNTRLQVEHPVTEAITGLDLVEWQLRVAAGEPLPLRQEQIGSSGHAIEARLYAEDPARGFLPSSGRVRWLRLPEDARIDSGIETGSEVTVHYDPLLAKIIVAGADRNAALQRMRDALARTAVGGLTSNVDFLHALLHHPRFAQATLHTAFLDQDPTAGRAPRDAPEPELLVGAAIATLLDAEGKALRRQRSRPDPRSPWAITDGWRPGRRGDRLLGLRWHDGHLLVRARGYGGRYELELPDGSRRDIDAASWIACDLSWREGDGRHRVVALQGDGRLVLTDGAARENFVAEDAYGGGAEAAAGADAVTAPMPGRVVAIRPQAGERVSEGEEVLVLEAMKMELSLPAPRDGTIEEILVAPGDFVEADSVLLRLDAREDDDPGPGAGPDKGEHA